MSPHGVVDLLFPSDERDPDFRQELQRLSRTGFLTASAIAIGGPLLLISLAFLWVPRLFDLFPPGRSLMAVAVALLPLTISFVPQVQRHLRLLGIVTGFLIAVEGIFGLIATIPDPIQAAQLAAIKAISVMLVAIAAFPLKPIQVSTMGLGITAVLFAALRTSRNPSELAGQASIAIVALFVVTLICTVLTMVLYRQRASAFRARRTAEESFEALREAQARLIVSENASSLGRFAAALSHEMNSPLGALGSTVDTLVSLVQKSGREAPERLAEVAADVSDTARISLERLRETMDRMKHFSNLDRAEVQVVNLNELWQDTVALLGNELGGKADVKLDLKPLPPIKCRPQRLSAVFSNLVRNAAAAVETGGTIRISSGQRGADVVLEVQDDGKGIPPERLARLFDPGFRTRGERVGTSWGLFVSRSIIREHGGQLEISSAPGRGTTATIVLPVPLAGAA